MIHNPKDVLEVNNEKISECSAEVAKWNYWDQEHLIHVHDGYVRSDCLYEKDNIFFATHYIKAPLLPFLVIQTPIFVVQHDERTMYTIVQQLGIVSKTTITIDAINDNRCKISMNYKFYLNGWRKILRPILKRLIPMWSEKVYKEDLPVKLRRQKFISLGFKDFVGMPVLKDRKEVSIKKTTLPINRPKKSANNRHPLKVW